MACWIRERSSLAVRVVGQTPGAAHRRGDSANKASRVEAEPSRIAVRIGRQDILRLRVAGGVQRRVVESLDEAVADLCRAHLRELLRTESQHVVKVYRGLLVYKSQGWGIDANRYFAADCSIPDFRFKCARPNLLILSDAFIHAGSDTRNTPRRIYTQWVTNKPGRFSSVSTDFLKWISKARG